jgi:hypothetical protein
MDLFRKSIFVSGFIEDWEDFTNFFIFVFVMKLIATTHLLIFRVDLNFCWYCVKVLFLIYI